MMFIIMLTFLLTLHFSPDAIRRLVHKPNQSESSPASTNNNQSNVDETSPEKRNQSYMHETSQETDSANTDGKPSSPTLGKKNKKSKAKEKKEKSHKEKHKVKHKEKVKEKDKENCDKHVRVDFAHVVNGHSHVDIGANHSDGKLNDGLLSKVSPSSKGSQSSQIAQSTSGTTQSSKNSSKFGCCRKYGIRSAI